jgi:predicted porin
MEIYRMKKSLFAIAATTAIAGAAQAQSSVTVYGILDMGYVGSNKTIVTGGTANVTTKTQTADFKQNAEQTSRLGFKGNEDLGGGASAFFTVELGLTPAYGQLSGSTKAYDTYQENTNNGGSAIDNRQSFIGYKKNGIGQAAVGRQYTPVFNAGAVTSPGQYNNMVGDVVYAGGSAGLGSDAAGFAGGSGDSLAFTNRASNALTAQSERFGGLQVSAMYALANKNVSQTTASVGGNTNWNGWGLGADFTWQKLQVTAAYQSFKTLYTNNQLDAALVTNLGGAGPTAGQNVSLCSTTSTLNGTTSFNATATSTCNTANLSLASNRTDKQTLVGATYDFGILKAYAQWVGRKIQEDATQTTSNGSTAVSQGEQLNRTAQQIGVRSFITPSIEGFASAGTGRMKATAGAATLNFNGWQAGTNYYLSKRTNLYAIYGQSQTSSSSMITGAGSSAQQYAVGMRHTF